MPRLIVQVSFIKIEIPEKKKKKIKNVFTSFDIYEIGIRHNQNNQERTVNICFSLWLSLPKTTRFRRIEFHRFLVVKCLSSITPKPKMPRRLTVIY